MRGTASCETGSNEDGTWRSAPFTFEMDGKRLKLISDVSAATGLLIRPEDYPDLLKAASVRAKHLSRSVEDYLSLIRSPLFDRKESEALKALLSVPESFFFRDKGQFDTIRSNILPVIIEKRRAEKRLSLWSAGCSSGEEPYSLAILVREALPDYKSWDITILGTDIRDDLLEKARRGLYSEWSFRMVKPDETGAWFRRTGSYREVDPSIRQMVEFRKADLMGDGLPGGMDLILCRNVFIYYKRKAVSEIAGRLASALAPGGYLITGHGELSGIEVNGLNTVTFTGSSAFQKASLEDDADMALRPDIPFIHSLPAGPAAKPKARHGRMRAPSAVRSAEGAGDAAPLILAASIYADAGELKKASECLLKALDADKLSIEPYLLLARISEESGEIEDAKKWLKKAIYLNPSFVPAYLELASIYDSEGLIERAERMRDGALSILSSMPQDEPIEHYGRTNAGELSGYLRKMAEGRKK